MHLEPILNSLTRDPVTARARDLRPGSDEESIFDVISGPDVKFVFANAFTIKSSDDFEEELSAKLAYLVFYNEADALEDLVLFPDDAKVEVEEFTTRMSRFEKEGPQVLRFVHDLDVDENLSDFDESSKIEDDDDFGDDDEEEDWEEGESLSSVYGKMVVEEKSGTSWSHGIFRLITEFQVSKFSGRRRIDSKDWPEMFSVLEKWDKLNNKTEELDMEGEWMEWMERDRSGSKPAFSSFSEMILTTLPPLVFKRMFHKCELDPNSSAAYYESMHLVRAIEQFEMHDEDRAIYCLLTLDFLSLRPDEGTGRRACRDIVRAYAMICPFFPNIKGHSIKGLLESKHGSQFKDSLLFKPEERARKIARRRTHTSNKHMPKSFWKEWRDIEGGPDLAYAYPIEWDKLTRPMIARCKFPIAPSIQKGTNTRPSLQRRRNPACLQTSKPRKHCSRPSNLCKGTRSRPRPLFRLHCCVPASN